MADVVMKHIFLPYDPSVIHVLQIGTGDIPILAFHGFSEEAASFIALAEGLPKRYVLYAFDFPYHGQTQWRSPHHMSLADLQAIVQQLLVREGFRQFYLMGFSMGGRLALSLSGPLLSQLLGLVLIAPDGIRTHQVFDIAVYPAWGRYVFRMVMKKPGLFFYLIRLLRKGKVLSKFIYEFTLNHMDTQQKRDRIYNTWVSLKNFNPPVQVLQRQLAQAGVPVHLFFGRYDKVIKPGVGAHFCKSIPQATLDIVPKGHQLVHPVLLPYLLPYLEP